MAFLKGFISIAALLSCMEGAYAGFDPNGHSNMAIYWGQNSRGQEGLQLRLSHYCESADVDVFMLAFVVRVNGIGGMSEVNWANQGGGCDKLPGTDLLHCPQIGEDIKSCQAKGKTIILSVGGAMYNESFTSPADAVNGANMIWDLFGPSTANSPLRPFDDAVVDGIDINIETFVPNMIHFANQIRSRMDADTSKPHYLTAAPQCPYPDRNNKEMLEGGVNFDALFVQFYNNYCGVNSWVPGYTQDNFNFAQWDEFARTVSANSNVRILVGAAANTGAGAGYVDAQRLASIANWAKRFDSFGGVMLWDASQAWANPGFVSTVKGALRAGVSRVMRAYF